MGRRPKPRLEPIFAHGLVLLDLADEGHLAIVDEVDADLALVPWKPHSKGYAVNTKLGYLHRIIGERMGLPPELQVDHVDTNRRNNSRSNLRAATHSRNMQNRRGNSTVGLPKGVWRAACKSERYTANICVGSDRLYLGIFDTAEAAARAYDAAAREHFGEFAWLNYPEAVDRLCGVWHCRR